MQPTPTKRSRSGDVADVRTAEARQRPGPWRTGVTATRNKALLQHLALGRSSEWP
ncbi:hypothetical protein [Streptomyces sp. 13-12-16]|uniref:hypothetical protein n=1 Tax=Streptomyces sp. 13-12-16 TaxID=1570823 RepID=UPI0015C46B78|nr:hypothetical protein [Streptomyces sp. 13-12-16]